MAVFCRNVADVAGELKRSYGDPHHHNKRNPLWELIFIMCSVRTDERKYLATYLALRRRFKTLDQLEAADSEEIAETIAFGGLSAQKSKAIKQILSSTRIRFGRPSLSNLSRMSNAECEAFLTSLPHVGRKVARCVMMYSLGRDVFPVDTHVWRICCRLGWIRPRRKDRTCSQADMDRIQARIPPMLRRSLHVNMISHGRKICTPISPKCEKCQIRVYCKRKGVTAKRLSEKVVFL